MAMVKTIVLYAVFTALFLAVMQQCGPAMDKQYEFQEHVYGKGRLP